MLKMKRKKTTRSSIFTKISTFFKKVLIKLFLKKEKEDMAVIYATLIVNGLKTFKQVPDVIKEDVKAILVSLGCPQLAE